MGAIKELQFLHFLVAISLTPQEKCRHAYKANTTKTIKSTSTLTMKLPVTLYFDSLVFDAPSNLIICPFC